ncbi:gastrin-releasing peptide [Danio aesculapii]|uniref:gastrin-releasing peptide n=1 Tax=Danio aesculapii TaxID=1142201 RepID=UPI0024C0248B|nr:gastrin-releasing peptide [Danio aesculapii]
MSVMCLVWRYRFVVSIILVVVLCEVFASDGQPIGKVYPRGNHWAVGHLMGKKSTDEQNISEDLNDDAVTSVSPDQDLQLERYSKHLPLRLYALMSERMTQENPQDNTEVNALKLMQRMIEKGRQWEKERDDRAEKVAEDLLRALRMQYEDES